MRLPTRANLPTSFSAWVLPLIMIVVALLGYEQYRWIDRVSQAEAKASREKLDASLKALADDFDAEITRVYLLFLGVEGNDRDGILRQAQERVRLFKTASSYPGLIASIATSDASFPGRMMDAGPPPVLTAPVIFGPKVKPKFGPKPKPGGPFLATSGSVIAIAREGLQVSEARAIRINLAEPLQIRIELAQNYIQDVLLPDLLKRHLGPNASRHYDVLVRQAGQPKPILSWGLTAAGGWESRAQMFSLRPDCLGERRREVSVQTFRIRTGRGGFSSGRNVMAGPAPDDLPALLRRSANCENTANLTDGLWVVNVRSRPSLSATIDAARRQSLAASFGALLLLGAGVMVLFVSGQRARDLAARHQQFAASVSHELRTPLAVISSASANLADGVIDDPKQVREYGVMIHSHSDRLSAMIENAIWFAQKNPGNGLEMEAVGVRDLFSEAAANCSRALAQAGMTLEQDVDPEISAVRANRVLLLQAIENLIMNAATHGRSGRWARIYAAGRADQVTFTVEDSGDGISPDEAKRVFEPFYRGKKAQKNAQAGLGLGLTLVRKIVEAHGGTIELRTRRNGGTAISFTILICQADEVENPLPNSLAVHG